MKKQWTEEEKQEWARDQRKARAEGRLSQKRIEELDAASMKRFGRPFDWDGDQDTAWDKIQDGVEEKKAAILEFCEKHGHQPTKNSKDPIEGELRTALNNYSNRDNKCFSPKLVERVASFPTWERFRVLQKQAQIRAFVLANDGVLPNSNSSNEEEKLLARWHGNYVRPKSGSFDEAYAKEMACARRPMDLVRDATSGQTKQAIRDFYTRNGRCPSPGSKDKDELRLGHALSRYKRQDSDCYDPEFVKETDKWVAVLEHKHHRIARSNKDKFLAWAASHGHRPSQSQSNLLMYIYCRFAGEDSPFYDADFAARANAFPSWREFKKTSKR